MFARFEPPAPLAVGYVDLPDRRSKLIVIEARPQDETRPLTFDGRPYRRVQTTPSIMPQERFEALLLDRAHARRRWENPLVAEVFHRAGLIEKWGRGTNRVADMCRTAAAASPARLARDRRRG